MSAAKRPAWLPNDCPSWCGYADHHAEDDHEDDRSHIGWCASIPALTDENSTDEDPTEVDVSLYQHYRDDEPRADLGRNGAPGTRLTFDEAEMVARELLACVAAGRADSAATDVE